MHIIRKASSKDIPDLVKLGKQLLDLHTQFDRKYYELENNVEDLFRNWIISQIDQPNQFIFIAEEQNPALASGKIVGFISGFLKSLYPWFKTKYVGHISYLIVDPTCRNNGIGRLLEEETDKWFVSKNVKYIEVYVEEKNYTGQNAWTAYKFLPFKQFLRKEI